MLLKTMQTKYNKFVPYIAAFSRNVSSTDSSQHNFSPIYKFSPIHKIGLLNRMKFYQTVLTIVGTPVTFALNVANYISSDAFLSTVSVGLSGCVVLYTFGFLTNKFVGIIYISDDKTVAKVSYLDFWGQRKDTLVDVNDIVPQSEMPRSLTDSIYNKFKRYSVKDMLKISINHGTILNDVEFKKLFIKGL